jgi:hypothetical protein
MDRTKGSKNRQREALGLIGFVLLYQPGHVAVVRTGLLFGGGTDMPFKRAHFRV